MLSKCSTFMVCIFTVNFDPFIINVQVGFPCGSAIQNQPANTRDAGSIPGLGRSPGEVNGNPLQYSCLGNPRDKEAWRATVNGGLKELDRTERSTAQEG